MALLLVEEAQAQQGTRMDMSKDPGTCLTGPGLLHLQKSDHIFSSDMSILDTAFAYGHFHRSTHLH